MDLQLDYWQNEKALNSGRPENGDNHRKSESEKSKPKPDAKSSIRTTFRSLAITHLMSPILGHSSSDATSFLMNYTTKEKRPKAVLKIGKKKEKAGDTDHKVHTIDGINRLICLTKSSHPLKVFIDGQDWSGVKFFQLSSHWQTHIK